MLCGIFAMNESCGDWLINNSEEELDFDQESDLDNQEYVGENLVEDDTDHPLDSHCSPSNKPSSFENITYNILKECNGCIRNIEYFFHGGTRYIVATSYNGELALWKLQKKRSLLVFKKKLSPTISSLKIIINYDNEPLIFLGCEDGKIRIFDINGTLLTCLVPENRTTIDKISSIIQIDATHVASLSMSIGKYITIWDLKSYTEIKKIIIKGSKSHLGMQYINDTTIASFTKQKIKFWNITTGKCIKTIVMPKNIKENKIYCLLPLNEEQFAVGHGNGVSIVCWDGTMVKNLQTNSPVIVIIPYDEGKLILGLKNNCIGIYNYYENTREWTIRLKFEPIVISKDGDDFLFAGSREKKSNWVYFVQKNIWDNFDTKHPYKEDTNTKYVKL